MDSKGDILFDLRDILVLFVGLKIILNVFNRVW